MIQDVKDKAMINQTTQRLQLYDRLLVTPVAQICTRTENPNSGQMYDCDFIVVKDASTSLIEARTSLATGLIRVDYESVAKTDIIAERAGCSLANGLHNRRKSGMLTCKGSHFEVREIEWCLCRACWMPERKVTSKTRPTCHSCAEASSKKILLIPACLLPGCSSLEMKQEQQIAMEHKLLRKASCASFCGTEVEAWNFIMASHPGQKKSVIMTSFFVSVVLYKSARKVLV